MKEYDVVIVGTGPAGIFAALELCRLTSARILMLDKGDDLEARNSSRPSPRVALSGWGGAGAYSDGKLNLSPEVGGFLQRYLTSAQLAELIDYVDSIYLHFGAPRQLFGTVSEEVDRIAREAKRCGLQLVPSRIRHLGTDNCFEVLRRIREYLRDKVEVRFATPVVRIQPDSKRGHFVLWTDSGETIEALFAILAPGRGGSEWLSEQAKNLHLSTAINPVDIGLRVEVPASVMEPLTKVSYEAKLLFRSNKFGDQVRTFCMCPYGEVILEDLGGLYAVNGQSYAHRRTEYTNFAILVSTTFTEPFRDPISYGRHIALLANLLGGRVIVQRLSDLHSGRRSTGERIQQGPIFPTLKEATPGDLSFVLPYRHLANILEMLEALASLVPDMTPERVLLYGAEVKFYSLQIKLSPSMETEIPNLFGIGDGVGLTRGLVQASASGVIAAREIARRWQNRSAKGKTVQAPERQAWNAC